MTFEQFNQEKWKEQTSSKFSFAAFVCSDLTSSPRSANPPALEVGQTTFRYQFHQALTQPMQTPSEESSNVLFTDKDTFSDAAPLSIFSLTKTGPRV